MSLKDKRAKLWEENAKEFRDQIVLFMVTLIGALITTKKLNLGFTGKRIFVLLLYALILMPDALYLIERSYALRRDYSTKETVNLDKYVTSFWKNCIFLTVFISLILLLSCGFKKSSDSFLLITLGIIIPAEFLMGFFIMNYFPKLLMKEKRSKKHRKRNSLTNKKFNLLVITIFVLLFLGFIMLLALGEIYLN